MYNSRWLNIRYFSTVTTIITLYKTAIITCILIGKYVIGLEAEKRRTSKWWRCSLPDNSPKCNNILRPRSLEEISYYFTVSIAASRWNHLRTNAIRTKLLVDGTRWHKGTTKRFWVTPVIYWHGTVVVVIIIVPQPRPKYVW